MESGPAADTAPSLDVPSMPAPVVEYLMSQLRTSQCYLEFGTGGSTVQAARIGVPAVISVESDPVFLDHVVAAVAQVGGPTVLHAFHADIGHTGAWGRPVDTTGFANWHGYAQRGFVEAQALRLSPDFILIDGRFRVACLLAAVLSARAGTPILFDDYEGRSKYHVAERFAPLLDRIDRAAVFSVPETFDARAVAFALARYSVVPAS